jgi:PAS domain S-box-containing protein
LPGLGSLSFSARGPKKDLLLAKGNHFRVFCVPTTKTYAGFRNEASCKSWQANVAARGLRDYKVGCPENPYPASSSMSPEQENNPGPPGSAEGVLHPKVSNKTPLLTVGILFVLAVVLANAAVSYRAARLLARNNQFVVHSFRVINELGATLSMMRDAESSYRGYVLTGDKSYLEPYEQAAADVPDHLDTIAELTRDNPEQQRRVAALRQLVQEKLQIARNVTELEQKGNHQAAVAMVNSHSGKYKMAEIRQLIASMRADEDSLLRARSEQSSATLREAFLAFSLASLVALIFVTAFYVLAKREVQERVQAAIAIRDRESWLTTTLYSIGDAVIATDATGRITFVNRVAEKLIGRSSEECEGKTIPEAFPIYDEQTGAYAGDPVEKAIHHGVTELGEHLVLRNHKGEEIPIEDSVAPILGAGQKVIGVVLVFRDVSTKRIAQESARRSEKLAATGRLAATIAHEINNPLEAATNLVYLAKHSATLGEDVTQYLDGIDHELARAAHITRKTLSFSRESSKPVNVNLAALLEEIVALYSSRIGSKHIRVEIDCPPHCEVVALRGELIQILSNLISNAIDVLDLDGSIRIAAGKEGDTIKLEVEDSGPGIPAENLEKIFEPFFTTKKDIGTGLGLWVVKDLIEKQGGTISVVSPSNGSHRGARFTISLPSLHAGEVSAPKSKAA